MNKSARALILAIPLVSLSLVVAPAGASGDYDDHRSDDHRSDDHRSDDHRSDDHGSRDDHGSHDDDSPDGHEVEADLDPIPGNGVRGDGEGEVEFDRHGQIDEFELEAHGLLAGSPHAAHIHFGEQARHECPTLADDVNGDGHLNTTEGAPAYGPIVLSLTTSGDTSLASALAVARFDTATDGTIDYEREESFPTDEGVAEAIAAGKGVVVIHGVDYNGNGVYDFEAGVSDLDPALPTEATDPAMCGVLR